MKIFAHVILICVTFACAGQSPASATEGEKVNMVIKAIEEPILKEQAAAALERLRAAKSDSDIKAATIALFEVPSSPAKIAAISWYSTHAFDKKPLTQSLTLGAQDLPFLIEWMLADGATSDDYFSEWGMIRYHTLDLLATEANEALGTSAKILDARPSKKEEPWEYYRAEMLGQWAQARIRESLAHKEWAQADKEVLNGLLSNLEQGKLVKTVESPANNAVTAGSAANVEKSGTVEAPLHTRWYWAVAVGLAALLAVVILRLRKPNKVS